LARSISAAIQSYSSTYSYEVTSEDQKRRLKSLVDKFLGKEYKETPLLDKLDEVVSIIAESYENDKFHALLLIVHDCLVRKEHSKKAA